MCIYKFVCCETKKTMYEKLLIFKDLIKFFYFNFVKYANWFI